MQLEEIKFIEEKLREIEKINFKIRETMFLKQNNIETENDIYSMVNNILWYMEMIQKSYKRIKNEVENYV